MLGLGTVLQIAFGNFLDVGNDPEGNKVDRQLFESRYEASAFLEPSDNSLNKVTSAIRHGVECLTLGPAFVASPGNHRSDSASL